MPEEQEIKEEIREEERKKEEKHETSDFAWKTLVAIILISLLVAGVLVPIRLFPRIISGLSGDIRGLFTREKSGLTIDDAALESGESFTLNLNATSTPTDDGTFTITYPCRQGISLEYSQSGEDADRETISCETPFTFTSKNKKITFLARSQATTTVEQPIAIDYTPLADSGTSTEKIHLGDVSVFISNTALALNPNPTATTTPIAQNPPQNTIGSNNEIPSGGTIGQNSNQNNQNNSNTNTGTDSEEPDTTPVAPRPVYSGPADLSINLLKVGVAQNGVIVPVQQFRGIDTLTIQFVITNIGGPARAGWTFEAHMPTIAPEKQLTYSPVQAALAQGSGTVNTLTVRGLRPGTHTITIILDQKNITGDLSRANNRIDIPITVY
jgi:hypothetical protein